MSLPLIIVYRILGHIGAYDIKPFHTHLSDMVGHRKKISVTIPKELIDWLDTMVGNRSIANRSHGVELAILCLKKGYDKK
jgi:hypothetical protein